MSVAPPRAAAQPGRRLRYAIAMAAAAVIGAAALPGHAAYAADQWGPGYAIPDSAGTPDASHLGAYGPPGSQFPHATGHAYCADPTLAGPTAAGSYGPITTVTTWTSKITGQSATPQDLARAAYVLSTYGETTNDEQAAAVDAAIYTLLNRGTTYALPAGARALQRLGYPDVPTATRTTAEDALAAPARYAGPYTLEIHAPENAVRPGAAVPVTADVRAASGATLPGIAIRLSAPGLDGTTEVTTDSHGLAHATLTAPAPGTTDISAQAAGLPATELRVQLPDNDAAQRMTIAGGTSQAQATAHLTVTAPHGAIKITKTAADTGAPMPGVTFQIKNSSGTTVAHGTTDAAGQWRSPTLASGTYTVHEAHAANGYSLAPDRTVTVTDHLATTAISDARIPAPAAPAPRPVTITTLPQTGA